MEDRIDSMSAFERVKLARHLDRPYTLDFVERIFEEFVEVKGDRRYAEDPAIVCGFARYRGVPVGVVGQQKGRDAKQRRYRNFGMTKGEGGSGGALAIGVADQVLMLENAVYSVITPEGCAAILFKDSAQAPRAAEFLRLTAPELHRAGIVDLVIPEPAGGAQNDHDEAARLLDAALWESLRQTSALAPAERLALRYRKLRALGSWGTLAR
jgi:acetyl-CoA carboxylase alpha subunit